MHHLVDPEAARQALREWPASTFVIIMAFVLPAVAARQHMALKAGTLPLPSRMQIYGSAIGTHAFLLLASWGVMTATGLDLFLAFRVGAFALLASMIALGLGLLLLVEQLNIADEMSRARTRLMAPHSGRELLVFYGMSVSAGVSEQLAYRGLLFSLLLGLTRNWWVAAVLAAIPFGVVHAFQGWRSAGIVTLIALRDQILVGLTGTLVFAIVIHIIHDMVAGTLLGRRARREESSLAVP